MASHYRRKDSSVYWVRVKRDGAWKGEPTTIRIDDREGLRKIKAKVAELTVGEFNAVPVVAEHRWERWVPVWLVDTFAEPKTLQRYKQCWAAVETYLDQQKVTVPSSLTYLHCKGYFKWRTKAQPGVIRKGHHNTAVLEMKVLGQIMKEAVRRGWCQGNPAYQLGVPRIPAKKKPEFKADNEATIRQHLPKAPQWMKDSFEVMMRHGCRISSTAVPMENIDETATVPVITFIGKKGKLTTAPIHPAILPIIAEARKRNAKVLVDLPRNPSKCWIQWLNRIGLTGFSSRSGRVSVVTRMARNNVTKDKIMDYVGHASTTVNDVYRRLTPADLQDVQKFL